MTTVVGIYLFDDVELLDFAGPYEVFTTASRVYRREHPVGPEPFSVMTVSQHDEPVRVRAGLKVNADCTIADHPDIDLLLVPGGVVTEELEKASVIRWIEATADQANLTASVCTGAFLLAAAGLLNGRTATTHWEDMDDLRHQFPAIKVLPGRRWIDQGDVISSGGISAGIDMSLHVVERIAGRELALKTARQMEFNWTENG
ncbi:DJ-1/PfpI family protein [Marinobacter sp. JSM 1782161]|uniref:DJ-1/PfpI family protein n=1 Tax=Marinobacter sp. JSM 1782161 TaxID=2685906 RepID=UPI00140354D8|nr:DJ-1/PfpI family protein [Marinobacter sp. JSM 1782161]